MSAEAVLRRASELGVTLDVAGDRIQYRPKSSATPEFVEEMRRHKPELVAQLSQHKDRLKERYEPMFPVDVPGGDDTRMDGGGVNVVAVENQIIVKLVAMTEDKPFNLDAAFEFSQFQMRHNLWLVGAYLGLEFRGYLAGWRDHNIAAFQSHVDVVLF